MSADDEPGQRTDSARSDSERRREALSQLAQSATGAPESSQARVSPLPNFDRRSPQNRTRLLFSVIAGILLIAVAGTAIFFAQHVLTNGDKGATTGASGVVAINTKEGDLSRVRDIAWSSDGARLATLGYERACPRNEAAAYDYHAGRLNVYDANHGKLAYQLQPDAAIRSALGLKGPVSATPDPNVPGRGDTSQRIIDYTHVAWRPGSSQLILTFNIYSPISPAQGDGSQAMSGALLTDLTGSQTKVFAHTLGKNEVYSGLWDLTHSVYQPSVAPVPSASAAWLVSSPLTPPSLAYQWGSSGKLAAQTPLPVATAPAISAIGNPLGETSFSIWQPGTLDLKATGISQTAHRPGVFTFSTEFAAISPDGRYLLANAAAEGWRLAVPGQTDPDASTLTDLGLNQSPVLPIRDTALAQIIAHWTTDATGQRAETSVPIYWSPDGRLLAAPTGQNAVAVYDCATGQQITVLHDQSTGVSSVSIVSGVAWSPDSKRALYWDGTSGAVRIVGLGK